jgi:hypothetical protein
MVSQTNNRGNLLLLALGPVMLVAGLVHLIGGDQRNAAIQLSISAVAHIIFFLPALIWTIRGRTSAHGDDGTKVVPPWRAGI